MHGQFLYVEKLVKRLKPISKSFSLKEFPQKFKQTRVQSSFTSQHKSYSKSLKFNGLQLKMKLRLKLLRDLIGLSGQKCGNISRIPRRRVGRYFQILKNPTQTN
jgi:hypothetical protein